jgi:hypothetical protein
MTLSRGRRIEALFLSPATFFLGSALPFGIIFTALALAGGLLTGLRGGQQSFLAALRSAREVFALLAMMLAAAAGLSSLGVTILLGRGWIFARPRRRKTVVVALAAGLAAVAYGCFGLDIPPHDSGARKALLVWIVLLSAPSILSASIPVRSARPQEELVTVVTERIGRPAEKVQPKGCFVVPR